MLHACMKRYKQSFKKALSFYSSVVADRQTAREPSMSPAASTGTQAYRDASTDTCQDGRYTSKEKLCHTW